jgi:hypothetical protein
MTGFEFAEAYGNLRTFAAWVCRVKGQGSEVRNTEVRWTEVRKVKYQRLKGRDQRGKNQQLRPKIQNVNRKTKMR